MIREKSNENQTWIVKSLPPELELDDDDEDNILRCGDGDDGLQTHITHLFV